MTSNKNLFETAPVLKAVISVAVPSIIGQIILVIYNLADTLFVSFSGSDEMITAVTVCMPAFMFLSAVSNLFGVGGASVISRALGKNDREKVYSASAFAFWGCVCVTAVYCLGALAFIDGFVDLLGGSSPYVHELSCGYMKAAVIAGGIPAAVSTLMAHLVRAEGFSALASGGIAVGGILNICLDPLFMFVLLPPGNEALGAAVATAISNAVAMLYYFTLLAIKKKELPLSLLPDRNMLGDDIPKDVFLVGMPACLMTLFENISYAVLDKLMVSAGTAAQAGIGVAKKVNMLAHSIVRGTSQGVLPLIGYNYSSGNRKRMKSVIFTSSSISVGLSLLCMALSLFLSDQLIGLFIRTASASRSFGDAFLRILCVGAPFSAFAYTAISFFQATGKWEKSLVIALLRKGLLDIPLMFFLKRVIPVFGTVYATPIADFVCCIIAVIMFIRWIRVHGKNKYEFAAE
ncbi:MAG: MATE family efflux transporter [Eubacteriales bacterium]|nr:MATE family efflux transporter [Eubacteriales bacterium]